MSADEVLTHLETAQSSVVALRGDVESLLENERRLRRELALAYLDVGVSPTDQPVLEIGGVELKEGVPKLVLAAAETEWRRGVREPPGAGWQRIDDYIRGPEGLHWTWEKRYTRNTQFAWCGAFAAFVFAKAGLRADLRRDVMPSTYRLHTWASDFPRRIAPKDLRVGDIVIVGPKHGKEWGAHITVCRSVGTEGIGTFEGNARGPGPEGDVYEGVIRRERPFDRAGLDADDYRVLYGVRPLAQDFDS